MVNVKICGMREPAGYESMLELKPDAIGFVFAPSKRRVSVAQPAAWRQIIVQSIQQQPMSPQKQITPKLTGVFVQPNPEEVVEIVQHGSLDVVQLHGEETAERCRLIRYLCEQRTGRSVSIWKALSLPATGNIQMDGVVNQIHALTDVVDLFLLDTHDPTYIGGSGVPFNWEIIPQVKLRTDQVGKPLWVAGGLDSHNVERLLHTYAIDGVDVSSGVETDHVKDLKKIESFIKRVKEHDDLA